MFPVTFLLIGGPRDGERMTWPALERSVRCLADPRPPVVEFVKPGTPARPRLERMGEYVPRLDAAGRFAWVKGEWVADWRCPDKPVWSGQRLSMMFEKALRLPCPICEARDMRARPMTESSSITMTCGECLALWCFDLETGELRLVT